MEGAPIPSLYPPFPANPVVMNVVSQFTVYDSVLGDLEAPRLWQYYVSLGPASKKRGAGRKEWESQGYHGGGGANSAQCHQQLPILGMKHTGAQELGYRP